MRGKKPYNIRNIEAHLNAFRTPEQPIYPNHDYFPNNIGRNIVFQTNRTSALTNAIQSSEQQIQNEYINAKFGVSKYASNLVSGKMFKKV
jgi:hypothetical protein